MFAEDGAQLILPENDEKRSRRRRRIQFLIIVVLSYHTIYIWRLRGWAMQQCCTLLVRACAVRCRNLAMESWCCARLKKKRRKEWTDGRTTYAVGIEWTARETRDAYTTTTTWQEAERKRGEEDDSSKALVAVLLALEVFRPKTDIIMLRLYIALIYKFSFSSRLVCFDCGRPVDNPFGGSLLLLLFVISQMRGGRRKRKSESTI